MKALNFTQKKEKLGKRSQVKREEGQALLIVVVALTIALSVGISTSLRTLSSVSRTSTADTASRVLAAAEGGIEHYLSFNTEELNEAIIKCTSGSPCTVDFPKNPADLITSRAEVVVETYEGSTETFYAWVDVGNSTSINLAGYTGNLDICWQGLSDVYYVLYNGLNINNWERGIIEGGSFPITEPSVSGSVDSETSPPCSDDGYRGYALNVPSGGAVKGLILIPLNDRVYFGIEPNDGGFTNDFGYKITSTGRLVQSGVSITKTVVAHRSNPYLPPAFFFGVFAEDGITTNDW